MHMAAKYSDNHETQKYQEVDEMIEIFHKLNCKISPAIMQHYVQQYVTSGT